MSEHRNLNLGKLIEEPQERDAVHIAVIPAIAMDTLRPAQEIGFERCEYARRVLMVYPTTEPKIKPVGIVDPFLKRPVFKGQVFWMFMFPNTITGLSHNWSHPAVDGEA